MSLLSKLLSGKKPTLSDVVDLLQGKDQKPAAASAQPAPQYNRPEAQQQFADASNLEETPLGRSWGEKMPDEPNQFNYPGTYLEYFEDIFHREFSAYRVTKQGNDRSGRTTVYTLWQGEQTSLVVEILSQHCDVRRLRADCERGGTPYLRFYYDHEGWWNARSYVVSRIEKALNR